MEAHLESRYAKRGGHNETKEEVDEYWLWGN